MNVVSLFDGMSCGQIALNRFGYKPSKYYASEIDKHAITVTQANYPNTVHLGDVTNWREWDIDWSSIDLILAGSPCQRCGLAWYINDSDKPECFNREQYGLKMVGELREKIRKGK